MQRRPTPVHYLKTNERDWTPAHVIFFDTETEVVPGTEPELNRLIWWHARSVVRRLSKHRDVSTSDGHGTTGAELVEWIEQAIVGHKSTWLYAHNLAFDLTTTNLIMRLVRRGWEVTDFATSDRSPFFRLSKGTRRLVVTDSWSWLPDALERIGKAIGKRKPPLPADVSDTKALAKRCRADVDILATAICQLMDWWDTERLGNWSITGASCGWNTFRHLTPAKSFLIHPDRDGVEHDRLAVRGGRRDAWRIGTFRHGPYVELDFVNAHPTLAAHLPMPCRRMRFGTADEWRDDWVLAPTIGTIARCVVRTNEPRYGVTVAGQVWYPVGTFETVLAGPELAMARDRGELVKMIDGHPHYLSMAMSRWARWVLDVAEGRDENAPPVARIAAKSWGRSVVGKFAARTHHLVDKHPTPYGGFGMTIGWDATRDCRMKWVRLDGTEWQWAQDQWSENAYPAVLAWIESHLRVRLATVIDQLPEGALISCNTDGVIIDAGRMRLAHARATRRKARTTTDTLALSRWCAKVSELTWPLVLRVKNTYDAMTVMGPASLELDGTRRWSGVRSDAVKVAEGKFLGRLWPKMGWQLAHNAQEGYLRPLRLIEAPGPYVHRWIALDGSVLPPEARLGPSGATELVPWPETALGRLGVPPADHQHPALAAL